VLLELQEQLVLRAPLVHKALLALPVELVHKALLAFKELLAFKG
jgi:hypothetical protein